MTATVPTDVHTSHSDADGESRPRVVVGGEILSPATTLPTKTATAERSAISTTRGRRQAWWRRRPGLVASVLLVVVVIGWAIAPSLFTSTDPLLSVPASRLRPPGPEHWFGTDSLGRDMYSRVVHGAATSLLATALAVLIGLLAGSAIGLISGAVGGRLDDVLMRLVDVLLAIPGLLLAMAVVTALGFGTLNVALAVGISAVAAFARLMRSEVMRVKTSVYIEAAAATGARWWAVLWRHILPNATGPVLVLAALEFGAAVLAVSALSFLGYGAPPPAPEWGSLISEGRNYLATSWWLTTMPGLVVVVLVLAANRISRALDGERSHR
jgi:peptide/nickel transport system permease protein